MDTSSTASRPKALLPQKPVAALFHPRAQQYPGTAASCASSSHTTDPSKLTRATQLSSHPISAYSYNVDYVTHHQRQQQQQCHHNVASSSASSSASSLSPSTSSTTSSSLRTPPDLFLNGLSSSSTAFKTLLSDGSMIASKRFLSISEIDQRLQLLDTLANDLDPTLPPPPSADSTNRRTAATSTKMTQAAPPSSRAKASTTAAGTGLSAAQSDPAKRPPPSQAGKKRTARELEEEQHPEARRSLCSSDGSTRTPRHEETSTKLIKTRASTNSRDYTPSPSPDIRIESPASADRSATKILSQALPKRSWTREQYAATGSLYQSKGRALKHGGDQRLREATSSFDHAAVRAAQQVAIYQHTEAILLFIYGFWCEDWASSLKGTGDSSSVVKTCILANWSSLSGLLHYVCANHERHKNDALAGFCRLLEAMVLRHTASYEQRQIQRRMSKLASTAATATSISGAKVDDHGSAAANATSSTGAFAAAASPPTSGSASSAPSPANGTTNDVDVAASLRELASAMSRLVADDERGAKLFAQTRSQLSNTVLASDFPQTWSICQSSLMDPFKAANDLDPASAPPHGTLPPQARWTWPLGAGEGQTLAEFPHIVNFGRSLLRESAQRRKLTSFQLADLSPL